MPSNAYKAGPEFREVHHETLEEARATRERTERALGFKLPKSNDELRLEREAQDGEQ